MSGRAGFPIRSFVICGVLAFGVLITGAGLWAGQATLASALLMNGTVESTERARVVQHPLGGVLAEVAVREGDRVAAGDVLARLDMGFERDVLAMTQASVLELQALQDRLEAQVTLAAHVTFRPELLVAAEKDAKVQAVLTQEKRAFDTLQEAAQIALDQLRLQKRQTAARLAGVEAQTLAARVQTELVAQALADQKGLLSRGLAQAPTILALEQEAAGLAGSLGSLEAQARETKGYLSELDSRIAGLVSDQHRVAAEGIAELVPRLRRQQREVLELTRDIALSEITAPIAGQVQGLDLHHAMAVLPAGAAFASIVPPRTKHRVLARIAPRDIDQVHLGQPVTLRLSAINAKTTPEVGATLTQISAATHADPRTDAAFFEVEITLEDSALEDLGAEVVLTAGMPVEVLIQTGEGTPLAFLLKPVTDYFARAFRES